MIKYKKLSSLINRKITDDEFRFRYQIVSVYAILGTISAIMTILNYFTQPNVLMYVTAIFSVVSVALCYLHYKVKINEIVATIVFTVLIYLLFSFFVISGRPDGFSALWILMLPSCGLLLFGKKRGTIVCAGMLLLIILYFYTGFGKELLQYNYSVSFSTRFPLLFIAMYCLSYFLESVRVITHNALINSKDQYRYLYSHDALTRVYNRYGFNEKFDTILANNDEIGFLIVDIDLFKNVNDTYGHVVGDVVLQSIADIITKCIPDSNVCRLGGEEFGVVLTQDVTQENVVEIAEQIRKLIQEKRIIFKQSTVSVTVSIGALFVKNCKNKSELEIVSRADECLYTAKNSGRNQVVFKIF